MSRPFGSKNKVFRPNPFFFGDNGDVFIVLTNAKKEKKAIAMVDNISFEAVRGYRWSLNKRGYVVTWREGKNKYLHHMILPKKIGFDVDHINRIKTDNRRSNLRYLTQQQNIFNHGRKAGVFFFKNRKKPYMARVGGHEHSVYLGYFKTSEEAQAVKDKYVLDNFNVHN